MFNVLEMNIIKVVKGVSSASCVLIFCLSHQWLLWMQGGVEGWYIEIGRVWEPAMSTVVELFRRVVRALSTRTPYSVYGYAYCVHQLAYFVCTLDRKPQAVILVTLSRESCSLDQTS